MNDWTGVARADFLEAFEGFWPCTRGQEQQRGTLLALLEQEASKWPVDVAIKGLRQCKVTENSNRVPTIQRMLECIREVAPRFATAIIREEPGISWTQFVKTNDWDAYWKRKESRGLNTKWSRSMLSKWRKGLGLLQSLGVRMREPGED